MSLPQFSRPGTLWYVSDGLIWDNVQPPSGRQPRRLPCSSKLFAFNPHSCAAKVTARFYHTDRPPTAVRFRVPAMQVESLDLGSLNEVPHNQSFWVTVESDLPLLPQVRHEDYTFWDPVPDAMISPSPYPGPLEDEVSWAFPDCYESDPVGPWHELETLTILNPGKRSVSVRVRYLLRNSEMGAEEAIEIAGERVAQLNIWERAPRPIGQPKEAPIHVIGDYAVRVDASAPVVAQTTRRARWSGYAPVIGARSTMGWPLRKPGHRTWHYPGGEIIDRGILPRTRPGVHPLNQCDNAWNLLFVNNPDDKRPAAATISFHKPDGSRIASKPIAISPLKSVLEWLHGEPWLGRYTRVNEPFGLTVTADRPVVPEVTSAEFEMWSQVMPGAMSAVNLYPGPLKDETTWWLGIAPAGGDDELPIEWQQSYHVLNPARRPVSVTLSFLGRPGRRRLNHQLTVKPGAVAVVSSAEIAGLPIHRPVAVRADGGGPFCAQTFVRAFTRGLPHVRSMYSHMGTPMTLER